MRVNIVEAALNPFQGRPPLLDAFCLRDGRAPPPNAADCMCLFVGHSRVSVPASVVQSSRRAWATYYRASLKSSAPEPKQTSANVARRGDIVGSVGRWSEQIPCRPRIGNKLCPLHLPVCQRVPTRTTAAVAWRWRGRRLIAATVGIVRRAV